MFLQPSKKRHAKGRWKKGKKWGQSNATTHLRQTSLLPCSTAHLDLTSCNIFFIMWHDCTDDWALLQSEPASIGSLSRLLVHFPSKHTYRANSGLFHKLRECTYSLCAVTVFFMHALSNSLCSLKTQLNVLLRAHPTLSTYLHPYPGIFYRYVICFSYQTFLNFRDIICLIYPVW